MISSIPLVRSNLPPVVVAPARKHNYFETLHAADATGDVRPLAEFLEKETCLALEELAAMPEMADGGRTVCRSFRSRPRFSR